MDCLEKQLRQYARELTGDVDEARVRAAAAASKAAFCAGESEKILSYPEFLFQQSRFIRKRWWMLQGGLLIILWLVLKGADADAAVQQYLGAAAPLFALLILPEIWKNRSSASLEVESAAYYSLRQVYSARIALFALVDFTLLSLFWLTAAKTLSLSAGNFLFRFLLPCNVTCCICFRTLCSRRIPSEPVALLVCMVWAGVWMAVVTQEKLYRAAALPVWAALLALSVIYLGYCVRKAQKTTEFTWEENPSWN